MTSSFYTAIPYLGAAVLAVVIGRFSDMVVPPAAAAASAASWAPSVASSVIFLVRCCRAPGRSRW